MSLKFQYKADELQPEGRRCGSRHTEMVACNPILPLSLELKENTAFNCHWIKVIKDP